MEKIATTAMSVKSSVISCGGFNHKRGFESTGGVRNESTFGQGRKGAFLLNFKSSAPT